MFIYDSWTEQHADSHARKHTFILVIRHPQWWWCPRCVYVSCNVYKLKIHNTHTIQRTESATHKNNPFSHLVFNFTYNCTWFHHNPVWMFIITDDGHSTWDTLTACTDNNRYTILYEIHSQKHIACVVSPFVCLWWVCENECLYAVKNPLVAMMCLV